MVAVVLVVAVLLVVAFAEKTSTKQQKVIYKLRSGSASALKFLPLSGKRCANKIY